MDDGSGEDHREIQAKHDGSEYSFGTLLCQPGHIKEYKCFPKYPVADAGYGSLNNYIFCKENNMELFMKFGSYKKETSDIKYHNDPFRPVNFKHDSDGNLICPNNKKFIFKFKRAVKGNKYGRKEEIYECENCSNCPFRDKCFKGKTVNRQININQELTDYHNEVIKNLESIHGALLRMNRSIQAEGTFGILKEDKNSNVFLSNIIKDKKIFYEKVKYNPGNILFKDGLNCSTILFYEMIEEYYTSSNNIYDNSSLKNLSNSCSPVYNETGYHDNNNMKIENMNKSVNQ